MNIGEGCIISVTKAEFSTAPKVVDEKKDIGVGNTNKGAQGFTDTNDGKSGMTIDSNIINISNVPIPTTMTTITSITTTTSATNLAAHNNQSVSNNRSNISMAFPPECLVQKHPVVLISNVYNPMDSQCQLDPNFFMDLEAGNIPSDFYTRIIHVPKGSARGQSTDTFNSPITTLITPIQYSSPMDLEVVITVNSLSLFFIP